jgi:hypothetical protein
MCTPQYTIIDMLFHIWLIMSAVYGIIRIAVFIELIEKRKDFIIYVYDILFFPGPVLLLTYLVLKKINKLLNRSLITIKNKNRSIFD